MMRRNTRILYTQGADGTDLIKVKRRNEERLFQDTFLTVETIFFYSPPNFYISLLFFFSLLMESTLELKMLYECCVPVNLNFTHFHQALRIEGLLIEDLIKAHLT